MNRSLVDVALRKTPADVAADLGRALPGEILRGHVEHHPRIAEALAGGWRHILIVRDPRDSVVSLLHWWKRHEAIDTWPFRLFHRLTEDSDRLRFLIEGWDSDLVPHDWPRDVDFPDVGRRFEAYAGWVREPACLVVRFEDLVEAETAVEARKTIARHLRPDLDAEALERVLGRMADSADPGRSKTFRRGTTGAWRGHLGGSLGERFDQLAGPLAVELGYGPARER